MFELSENGWYLLMSVARTGPYIDLSTVTGAAGPSGNVVPARAVPAPISAEVTDTISSPGWWLITAVMPPAPAFYTDAGGPPLIDGASLIYMHAPAAPGTRDPTQYLGWASDPSSLDDTAPRCSIGTARSTWPCAHLPGASMSSWHC